MTETLRRGYPGMKVGIPLPTGCMRACFCHCKGSGTETAVQLFIPISYRPLLHLAIILTTRVGEPADTQLSENTAPYHARLLQVSKASSIVNDGDHGVTQSIKDMPVVQDGPPPGGFPSIRYARRLPSTGPTGFTLFAVGTAVMAFGFYRVCYPSCPIRMLVPLECLLQTALPMSFFYRVCYPSCSIRMLVPLASLLQTALFYVAWAANVTRPPATYWRTFTAAEKGLTMLRITCSSLSRATHSEAH